MLRFESRHDRLIKIGFAPTQPFVLRPAQRSTISATLANASLARSRPNSPSPYLARIQLLRDVELGSSARERAETA